MKARLVDLSRSLDGRQRLTIEVEGDARHLFDELHDQPVELTLKKYHPGRSLNANGYAWVLIDKIAEKMRLSKTDVYRDHIREIGGVSETVCVQNKAVDRLCGDWERRGIGWQTQVLDSKIPGCKTVTLYYGSSTYDTKQMAALIDSLVQTCKALRIETLPPERLEGLITKYAERQR
jgi:hypothetical protein